MANRLANRRGTGARSSVKGDARAARRAFTLIEILIALAMLVLLAGFSWPAIESQITGSQLPESATRFRDMLYMVRAKAIRETRRVRVRFEPQAQQPIIEIERDPFLAPDVWEPVEDPWAEQAMESLLLSDVQVHDIRLGRPEFTKPISINDQPQLDNQDNQGNQKDTLKKDEISALDTDEMLANQDYANPKSQMSDSDYPVDDNRPVISFDAQGIVGWALITIARYSPDDDIPEGEPSRWVLLDGRTGLASVREPMTEDQQLDADNYVKRENLYLPDLTDLGQLSFKSTGFGGQPAVDSDGDGIPDDTTGDSGDGSSTNNDLLSGGGNGMNGANAGGSDSTQSDIDDKLDGSGLTQQERDNIRNALGGGGSRGGGGNRAGSGGNRGGGKPGDNGPRTGGNRNGGGRPRDIKNAGKGGGRK